VVEDGGDDVGVGDGGEDADVAGAARADLEVLAEDAAEELGPRQARGLARAGVVGGVGVTGARGP
jgi:hypothetical protein